LPRHIGRGRHARRAIGDGQSAVLNAADYLQRINQSQTLEELQANYNFVMGEVKNDRTLSKLIIEAKDKRKAEL
jgi:hypothetical protein